MLKINAQIKKLIYIILRKDAFKFITYIIKNTKPQSLLNLHIW